VAEDGVDVLTEDALVLLLVEPGSERAALLLKRLV